MDNLEKPLRTHDVTVESLGGLGDGIARFDGKPLFIAKACPGDRLEVEIIHENRDAYQGTITRILTPGPQRQDAPCRYFDRCGGCTLQQFIPSAYRAFKTRMLHAALERAGYPMPQAEVMFLPAQTRRRVEFKVKYDAGKAALAFHALRSHTAIAIDHCLILRPELQALIAPLGEALSELPFAACIYAASLTLADRGIDLLLTVKNYDSASIPPLDEVAKTLGLARISVRTPDSKARLVTQLAPVEMQLGPYAIALPPEAFLQATSEGQAALTQSVMAAMEHHRCVVDLFCGIGTYSLPLSTVASVHAAEGEKDMVQAIQDAAKRHAIPSLSCEQRDLFKQPLNAKELARFDAAIINPPRVGAKAQTEQLAQSPVATIAMVSCNPATFARDAAILKNAGFSMVSAQGIDQFVWSQHLETVAVFKR